MKKKFMEHPYFQRNGVLVMAHRGGGGLAPENTLEAFRNGKRLGSDIFELDIRASRDGVLMVIHDETVDRTTDGTGKVHELSLKELKQLDAGHQWTEDGGKSFPFRGKGIKIPTLEEMFNEFPGMRMNIDIKQETPSIVQPFGDLINKYDRKDITLAASFDLPTIRAFRKTFPDILTAANVTETRLFLFLHKVGLGALVPINCSAFQVPEFGGGHHILTNRFIRAAQRRNIQVHPWTIDTYEDLQRFIDLGVEGIITDYPDRLMELLERKSRLSL